MSLFIYLSNFKNNIHTHLCFFMLFSFLNVIFLNSHLLTEWVSERETKTNNRICCRQCFNLIQIYYNQCINI